MCFLLTNTRPEDLLAERDDAFDGSPIPKKVLSNGEFDAPDQTERQARVQALIGEAAARYGRPHGMDRRRFCKTLMGLSAAFLAMNEVFGPSFLVDEAHAADPEAAEEWAARFADQFIFDDQVHFVHPGYTRKGLLELRRYTKKHNNPAIRDEDTDLGKLQFQNFCKEIFLDSDTTVALLSGAPAEDKQDWFLPNELKDSATEVVNTLAGGRRMMYQAVFNPGMPGWEEELDRAIALQPSGFKGYTVGDPQAITTYAYRLDDEKLVYPAYEKMLKAGITTVCIHKGLMPENYRETYPNWEYATVDDLPKAASDWPDLTFIIYHSAIRPGARVPDEFAEEAMRTGYIKWVSDLAAIPEKHGVTNVAGDLGTVFAGSAVMHPQLAAMIIATLVKGLGEDNVYWGTDSIWHGSPHWQIEAFRRLELSDELAEKHDLPKLGDPRSTVREKIIGLNGARHYGLDPKAALEMASQDGLAALRREYIASGRDERTGLELVRDALLA